MVCKDVSFTVKKGESLLLCGASGSALLPDIILLDEPSSNLDWGAISELRTAIQNWKKKGKTIVISEHRLWYLKDVIDRVIYMDNGDIRGECKGENFFSFADDKIEELKLRPVHIEEKYIVKYGEISQIEKANKTSNRDDESSIIFKGKKRIGLSYMVMQDVNHQLFTDSVESEVLLSMKNEDKEKCSQILDSLGLFEYRDKHPMSLSGGQKQRVAIASAIAADAKLLLFDEPTSGLDYSHMVKVSELLRELADAGRTVLVSTHDPELIELCCDYVLSINNGKVIRQP